MYRQIHTHTKNGKEINQEWTPSGTYGGAAPMVGPQYCLPHPTSFVCVCVILLQFLQFLCVFNFLSIFVAIFEYIDFFQLLQFLCELICLNFCCKSYVCQFLSQFLLHFYVCWLLSRFFLQFLCVLIFVSVFVAICECVDFFQFLQFLWVLICLRFLELSVVFWNISLPNGCWMLETVVFLPL